MCSMASESSPSLPGTPAFIVGITGYMDLTEHDAKSLPAKLQLIFRFLRHGGAAKYPDEHGIRLSRLMAELLVPFPKNGLRPKTAYGRIYAAVMEIWKERFSR